MGKKGGTRPVFDYHYSLDYGLCHGPIDHLNKVWIKDKQILCDIVDRRTDYEIYLPELFGGDDAEGGTHGTIEVYTGEADQYSSAELAARGGSTVGQTPGYRNLCHLFFRGLRDSASEAATAAALGDGIAQNIYKKRLPTAPPEGYPTAQIGWRWISNNPYMPTMKANVTRLPGAEDDPYRAIWPLGATFGSVSEEVSNTEPQTLGVIRDDNGQGVDLTAPGTIIDLLEQGATQEQIDAGDVLMAVDWTVVLRSWDAQTGGAGTATTSVRFYDAIPTTWDQTPDDEIAPLPGEASDVTVTENITLDDDTRDGYEGTTQSQIAQLTAPPGARYVQIAASYDAPSSYRVSAVGTFTVAIGVPLPTAGAEPEQYLLPTGEFRVVDGGGVEVQDVPPWFLGTVVDLFDLGFTQEEIDAGAARVAQLLVVDEAGETIPALDDDLDTQTFQFIEFHTVEPVNYYDANSTTDFGYVNEPHQTTFTLPSILENDIDVTTTKVPAFARYVQFRMGYTPAVGRTFNARFAGYQVLRQGYTAHWCLPDQTLGPLPDANPAHIIWECMVNRDWGKSTPVALMDTASFDACAEVLYNERMGMSIGWFQQSSIEDFIQDVLDHIQAFFYFDPGTSLWTLKLLRDDYDVGSLKTLDETNCIATNRKRRLWGETINEIVVSYTDPNTEKASTVSAQNLANIAIQGSIISETRDYHGFRNPDIAQVVAERDVAEAGYPLFSCEVEVNRSEWDARPGDLRKFSWPEDGIVEIIVRVMSVDYGKPTDRTIKLEVSEDMFSIEHAQYSAPQRTEWTNRLSGPTPLEAQAAITVPLPSILLTGETVSDWDANYPSVPVALFADDDGVRPSSVAVHAPVQNANGSSSRERIGAVNITLSGRIGTPWVAEAETRLPRNVIDGITRTGARAGDFFMLGVTDADSELVMLDSLDTATGEWVVARGMWDTVPRAWPSGTRLWRFSLTAAKLDPAVRNAGETVEYLLLPVTQLGTLAEGSADPLTATFNERPYAPFRPSNCQVDGNGFGDTIYDTEPYPTEIVATWNTRNRTTEDQVALRWDDANAAVESGQTTVLRILNRDGSEHGEITGLTGTSHTIDTSLLPPAGSGYIEFLSERDGIRSVYGARRYFEVAVVIGYGQGYGQDYGGEVPA